MEWHLGVITFFKESWRCCKHNVLLRSSPLALSVVSEIHYWTHRAFAVLEIIMNNSNTSIWGDLDVWTYLFILYLKLHTYRNYLKKKKEKKNDNSVTRQVLSSTYVIWSHFNGWFVSFLEKKHDMPCWDVRVSAPFYSQPVRVHYYKPYWFPDFHLICLRDALLLTLYDLILFYWTCIVLLW